MYSYDFFTKGNVAAFRCLEQDFIYIDKDDMTRVLSAEGYWYNENSKIILKENNLNKLILLENYLLMNNEITINKINNKQNDFRKSNLLIQAHNYLPYFIRPFSERIHRNPHSPFTFSINKQFKNIGYVTLLPVSQKNYEEILDDSIDLSTAFKETILYENNSSYYHFIFGDFPNEDILLNFLCSYYKQILFFLKMRSVNILKCCFLSTNPAFEFGKILKDNYYSWNMFGNKNFMKLQIDLSSSYY